MLTGGSGGFWGTGRQWHTAPTPTTNTQTPQQQGMQQALDAARGMAGPQLLQNDLAANQLARQLGYADTAYGFNSGVLQQNAALDRQRLGLANNDLGVDRDAIARQMGVSQQLQDLANQAFGISREDLQAQVRQQGEGLNRNLEQLMSQATAKGSVGSVMNRRGREDIAIDKNEAWGQFLRNVAGVDIEQKSSDIGFTEDRAKLQDRLKTLDNQAAKLGIDRKQLEANLQQGLQKLGIERLMTVENLIDAMTSNDIDKQAIAQQIFRDAMGMSQYFIDNVPFSGGGGGGFGGHGASGSWEMPGDKKKPTTSVDRAFAEAKK